MLEIPWLDSVRFGLALLLLALLPGALLFWFSIHPLIEFWRRFPARWVLVLHYGASLVLGAFLLWQGRSWLGTDYGSNAFLLVLGVAVVIGGGLVRRSLQRQLSNQRLTGLPELDPERADNRLLCEGLYSHIRHPRYLQIFVTLCGYSLIVNYRGIYWMIGLFLLLIGPIIWFEERELRNRFGDEYIEYERRVPHRFVPGWF